MSEERAPRICAEVRRLLPAYRDGRLPGWRRRAVHQHLRRCTDCAAELELVGTLAALKGFDDTTPPPGLLDDLLATASGRGVRARVAGPARGAVSGARPALSAAFLLGAGAAGTGVGFSVWKGAQRIRRRNTG